MPMRRDSSASRMWLGWARFSTVLLRSTINSSCSRLKVPVSGLSCVLVIIPSLAHCQNCACVVQNSLRSRQTTSAVFLFFFFFLVLLALMTTPSDKYTSVPACLFTRKSGEWQHAVPVREASTRGGVSLSKFRNPNFEFHLTTTIVRSIRLFASPQT